jgi:hypothetical protein
MTDTELRNLQKDIADIKAALLGPKVNGTITGKGLLDRVGRLEKGLVALGLAVLMLLGITGGASLVDFIQGL